MMVSLLKKGHSPSGTIGREQEHVSSAERNQRECSEGKRPRGLFVRKSERPNESFGGDGKSPNASFSSGNKRSSTSFVDEGKRPNTLSIEEQKHCCNVENGCAEQSAHRDKGTRPMAMFRGEQKDCLMFEKRQGKSSDQMNLKIETEEGNNERDKSKADAEEASRVLLEEFCLDSNRTEKFHGKPIRIGEYL